VTKLARAAPLKNLRASEFLHQFLFKRAQGDEWAGLSLEASHFRGGSNNSRVSSQPLLRPANSRTSDKSPNS
jgi:hypothetical protein